MKVGFVLGIILLCFTSCIREHYSDCDYPEHLAFEMLDVPYILDSDTVAGYQPYYAFTERLDVFAFGGKGLDSSAKYGYEYCRENPIIPWNIKPQDYTFLFVANLFDPKMLDWTYDNNRLAARFSILDHREPPLLLVATKEIVEGNASLVPVRLNFLVSRLEIRLDNPPAWVNGMAVSVTGTAGMITNNYVLGDTTYIYKNITVNNTGPGRYRFGVNAFPTYQGRSAILNIRLTGRDQVRPLIVDDSRLHLLPGVITRVDLLFDAQENVTVSIEVDGKWEVVDEGQIII